MRIGAETKAEVEVAATLQGCRETSTLAMSAGQFPATGSPRYPGFNFHKRLSPKSSSAIFGISPQLGGSLRGVCNADTFRVPAAVPMQANDDLDFWEHKIETGVKEDAAVSETDREAITRARRGQGLLRTASWPSRTIAE